MRKHLLFLSFSIIILCSCNVKPEVIPSYSSENITDENSRETTDYSFDNKTAEPTEAINPTPTVHPVDVSVFFKENEIEGLEYWILQDVTDLDFSGYVQDSAKLGTDGGAYYGKGYTPLITEEASNYEWSYVEYSLSHWPDRSDKDKMYITYIWITDPRVKIFGRSLNNTLDEWRKVLNEKGFSVSKKKNEPNTLLADSSDGNYTIRFTSDPQMILIYAPTSNREGLCFD